MYREVDNEEFKKAILAVWEHDTSPQLGTPMIEVPSVMVGNPMKEVYPKVEGETALEAFNRINYGRGSWSGDYDG